jgi:hypothetical protein
MDWYLRKMMEVVFGLINCIGEKEKQITIDEYLFAEVVRPILNTEVKNAYCFH